MLCLFQMYSKVNQLYIYTHPLFSYSFSIGVITEYQVDFLMLCMGLYQLSIFCSSVYISIPIFQFIPLPLPPGNCMLPCSWGDGGGCGNCFLHLWLHFCFYNNFICTFFLNSYYKYTICCLSFSMDLLHSVWQFPGLFMLLQVALFPSFYGWVIFSCVCVPILTHSVSGHLRCFHVLAFVNNAAVNTEAHVFLNFFFFWIYAQE